MAYKLGITTHSYANIERGRVDVSTNKLISIARIFGMKAYQILRVAEDVGYSDEFTTLARELNKS